MSNQLRTVIDIPDDQTQALHQISERANASRAEVIRRAIADYIARHEPDETMTRSVSGESERSTLWG